VLSARKTAPRVVVYHQGGLRTGQFTEDRFGVNVSRTPFASPKIVFEIVIAAANRLKPCHGILGQQGTAQVRMNHYSGRIYHRLERKSRQPVGAPRY
jgi:hypothetical protein